LLCKGSNLTEYITVGFEEDTFVYVLQLLKLNLSICVPNVKIKSFE